MSNPGNNQPLHEITPINPINTLTTSPPSPSPTKVPDGWARLCRPKPQTSTYLDKNIVPTNGMYFQNIGEAMAAMALNQWQAPASDPSIPKTDEDHRKFAKQLVHAFKDVSMAIDTADNAYRKRVTPGRKEYYKDWAIESCAWHILKMVKDMHTIGFSIPIYDRALMDSIGQTQLWTFQERVDWICLVLKASKSIAANFIKHEKMWTIIGAPHRMFHSTLVNTESNANRNRWVKDGRALDPNHAQNRPKDSILTPDATPEKPERKRRRITYTQFDNTNPTLSMAVNNVDGIETTDGIATADATTTHMPSISIPAAIGTHSIGSALSPTIPSSSPTSMTALTDTVMQHDGDVEMVDVGPKQQGNKLDNASATEISKDVKETNELSSKSDQVLNTMPAVNEPTFAKNDSLKGPHTFSTKIYSTDEMEVAMTLASLYQYP